MRNVKMSVIVPCHNTGKYLRECLNSIENQSIGIDNLQVILVNDASEDDTWQIIMDFEEKYPDKTVAINLESNVMQGAARNIALNYVEGKYVRFLDSDDCFQKDSCELLYNLAEIENLDIVCFEGTVFQDEAGFKDDGIDALSIKQVMDFSNPENRRLFLMSDDVGYNHWKKLYNTSLLKRNGATFFEGATIFEEIKFVYPQFLYANRIAIVEDQLTFNRNRKNSATKFDVKNNSNRIMCNAEAQMSLLEYLKKDIAVFELYRKEIIDFFVWHFYYYTCEFALAHKQFMSYEEYDWMRTVTLNELKDDADLFVMCNPAFSFFVSCMKNRLVQNDIDVMIWCEYVFAIMSSVMKSGGQVSDETKTLMNEVLLKLS